MTRIRFVELDEAGIGPLWVNSATVRCVTSGHRENQVIIEFDNGDQKTVMGEPQSVALLLERDRDT